MSQRWIAGALILVACAGVAIRADAQTVLGGNGGKVSPNDIVRAFGKTRGVTPQTQRAPAPQPPQGLQANTGPMVVPTPAPATPQPVAPAATVAPRPAGCQPDAGTAVALKVTFGLDSAQLTAQAHSILEAMAQAAQSPELSTCKFVVEGHTDGRGSPAHNQSLSQRRADAVREFLVAQRIDPQRLVPVGKGSAVPLIPSNPYADENRRVQFQILN